MKDKIIAFLLSPAGTGITIKTAVSDIASSLSETEQYELAKQVKGEIEACPNCGTWFYQDEFYEDDIYDDSYAAYCPECGAFMKEIL